MYSKIYDTKARGHKRLYSYLKIKYNICDRVTIRNN